MAHQRRQLGVGHALEERDLRGQAQRLDLGEGLVVLELALAHDQQRRPRRGEPGVRAHQVQVVLARLQPAHGDEVLPGLDAERPHQLDAVAAVAARGRRRMEARQVHAVAGEGDGQRIDAVQAHDLPQRELADGEQERRLAHRAPAGEAGHAQELRRVEARVRLEQRVVDRHGARAPRQQRHAVLHVQQVDAVAALQQRELPAQARDAALVRHLHAAHVGHQERRIGLAQARGFGAEEDEVVFGRAPHRLAVKAQEMAAAALIQLVEGVEIDADARASRLSGQRGNGGGHPVREEGVNVDNARLGGGIAPSSTR